MKLRTLLVNFLLLLLTGVTITTVVAQELCETLVRDAWELVSENCEGVDGDSACYGHDSLVATFNASAPAATFARPGDQNTLGNLHTIRTEAFDEADEAWGIGDILVPAASFGGTDDQHIVIFTVGDVIVENAAEAAADEAPMTAFNFTTGGSSECREAPNAVFIQSPPDLKVDLKINSTPIRIGSTIVLGTDIDPATGYDVMWFGVLEGSLTLYPDTPQQLVVPAGGFTTTLLSDSQGRGLNQEAILTSGLVPVLNQVTGEPVIGVDGEPYYRQAPIVPFTEPQPITPDGEGFAGWGAFQFVNLIPTNLLTYPVSVPDVAAVTANAAAGGSKPQAKPTTAAPQAVTNWCFPGGPWDDGRCVNDWFWAAGWYYAALDNGLIDEVPAAYQTSPDEPTPTAIPATPTSVVPTNTPTNTLTFTPSLTPTNTPTFTPTNTPTNTSTPTFTPTFTLTFTPTFTPSLTPLPPFDAVVTGCALQADMVTYNITIQISNIPPNTDRILIYDSSGPNPSENFWGGEEPYTFTSPRLNTELPLLSFEAVSVSDVVLAGDGALGAMPPCTP